jgi:hypothetical protein
MVHMLNFWHVLRVQMPLHARHRYDHRRKELTHSRPPFQFPPFMGNNERKEISSDDEDDE